MKVKVVLDPGAVMPKRRTAPMPATIYTAGKMQLFTLILAVSLTQAFTLRSRKVMWDS